MRTKETDRITDEMLKLSMQQSQEQNKATGEEKLAKAITAGQKVLQTQEQQKPLIDERPSTKGKKIITE